MNQFSAPGKYGLIGVLVPAGVRIFFIGHPTHHFIIWSLMIVTIIAFIISLSFIVRFFRFQIQKRKEIA